MDTVNESNLNPELESILRRASVSPSQKVQAALLLRGDTLQGQAGRLSVHKVYLCSVLNGHRDSGRLRREIAADIRVSEAAIFGDPDRVSDQEAA